MWTVAVSAWAAAMTTRIGLDWLLGLEGAWVDAAVIATALLGALVGAGDARSLPPMDPKAQRDTLVGWTAIVGAVGATACLLVPVPFGPAAAAVVVALTVLALRRW